jgi:hypothetical protein
MPLALNARLEHVVHKQPVIVERDRVRRIPKYERLAKDTDALVPIPRGSDIKVARSGWPVRHIMTWGTDGLAMMEAWLATIPTA